MLIGVHDDAEIHAVNGGVAVGDVDFALEIGGRHFGVGLFDGVERALEPGDDFRLGSNGLVHPLFVIGGHLGASDAEKIKICIDDVHVDFAGGTNAGRGAPGKFVGGSGFGESDELLRDVEPLAVVALPEAFRIFFILRAARARSGENENHEKEHDCEASVHLDMRMVAKSRNLDGSWREIGLYGIVCADGELRTTHAVAAGAGLRRRGRGRFADAERLVSSSR